MQESMLEPAYPIKAEVKQGNSPYMGSKTYKGNTRFDYFVGQALTGLASAQHLHDHSSKAIAKAAVDLAIATLEEVEARLAKK